MCTSIAETVKYCDIIIPNIFIAIIIIIIIIMLYSLFALKANNRLISTIFTTIILITIIALFLYSLLALIANNRLVCSGRVKSLPIDGVVWYVALHNNDGDGDDVDGDVDDDVDGDVNHDGDDDVANRDGDEDCGCV